MPHTWDKPSEWNCINSCSNFYCGRSFSKVWYYWPITRWLLLTCLLRRWWLVSRFSCFCLFCFCSFWNEMHCLSFTILWIRALFCWALERGTPRPLLLECRSRGSISFALPVPRSLCSLERIFFKFSGPSRFADQIESRRSWSENVGHLCSKFVLQFTVFGCILISKTVLSYDAYLSSSQQADYCLSEVTPLDSKRSTQRAFVEAHLDLMKWTTPLPYEAREAD